jgi:hypothetical protein
MRHEETKRRQWIKELPNVATSRVLQDNLPQLLTAHLECKACREVIGMEGVFRGH